MSDQKTLVLLDPEGANIDDFVAALTEGREEEEDDDEEEDEPARRHLGPGPHPSGSSQDVHGSWAKDGKDPRIVGITRVSSAHDGDIVHYTTPANADAIEAHGFSTVDRDPVLGGSGDYPPGSIFLGLHGYDFMEYMASEYQLKYPNEPMAILKVDLAPGLRTLSLPSNPRPRDLPEHLRPAFQTELSTAAPFSWAPANAAAARVAWAADYDLIRLDQELVLLPRKQEADDA